MNITPIIKLYGAERCHKTNYYKELLNKTNLPYQFLDVEKNKDHAEDLRGLYENGKLNFPTITIGEKKLRNPSDEELEKWLNKLILSHFSILHDKNKKSFILDINGEVANVDYQLKNDKMYLIHSEVPYHLRGKGIGKVLVEKTFEQLTKEGYTAVAICSYIQAVAKRSERWNKVIKN